MRKPDKPHPGNLLMIDATQRFLDYAEAKRHLWNVYMRPMFTDVGESHPIDTYQEIERLLFKVMIDEPFSLKLNYHNFGDRGISSILVDRFSSVSDVLPMSIAIERDQYYSFDLAVSPPMGTRLEFIEFFDYDRYRNQENSRVRVYIKSFPGYEQFVGKEAVIETFYAKFLIARELSDVGEKAD